MNVLTTQAQLDIGGWLDRRQPVMAAALIGARRRTRLRLCLMVVVAVCGACHSDTPTRPSGALSPSPVPSPSPAPPQVVPHRVEIVYDPDMWNSPAPRDSDDAYLLDWAVGWYCIWLDNIPSTPADHCREYAFTFSWLPAVISLPGLWSGETWNRGCHIYPNQINPGACFESPAQNSVSALQSITIVGKERRLNGAETEMFRTEVAIRFQDP